MYSGAVDPSINDPGVVHCLDLYPEIKDEEYFKKQKENRALKAIVLGVSQNDTFSLSEFFQMQERLIDLFGWNDAVMSIRVEDHNNTLSSEKDVETFRPFLDGLERLWANIGREWTSLEFGLNLHSGDFRRLSRLLDAIKLSLRTLRLKVQEKKDAKLIAKSLRGSSIENLHLHLTSRDDQHVDRSSFGTIISALKSMKHLKKLAIEFIPYSKPQEISAQSQTIYQFNQFVQYVLPALPSLKAVELSLPYFQTSLLNMVALGIIRHPKIEQLSLNWDEEVHELGGLIPALFQIKSFSIRIVHVGGDDRLSSSVLPNLFRLLMSCRHLERLVLIDVLAEATETDFRSLLALLSSYTNLISLSLNDIGASGKADVMMNDLHSFVQDKRSIQEFETNWFAHEDWMQKYHQIQHQCTLRRFSAFDDLVTEKIPLSMWPRVVSTKLLKQQDPLPLYETQILFDLVKEMNGVLIQRTGQQQLNDSICNKRKRERLEI